MLVLINYIKEFKNQKGSAIFLVILILTGILTATIGINNLVVKGIKLSRSIAWSSPAYFAAETGMEKALHQIRKVDSENIPNEINENFNLNGQIASWKVGFKCDTTNPPNSDCAGELIENLDNDTTLTIKSTGEFQNVNRSISLSFCVKGKCPK